MATSNIRAILDNELAKQLQFTFRVVKNHTRPNATDLQARDQVLISVTICNRAEIPMRLVRGAITPGVCADFFLQRFDVPELGARQEFQIATIETEILHGNSVGSILDEIGCASVSASADLTTFRFGAPQKPLIYSRGSSTVEPARHPGAPARGGRSKISGGSGLPLSEWN